MLRRYGRQMKLLLSDIKILTEGQQLEKAILKKYPNMAKDRALIEFANLADRSPNSIGRYTRSRIIESKSFKIRANVLSGAEFLNEEEQIAKYIEIVYNNINEYDSEEDIRIFEKLRDICIEKNYNKKLAKVYLIISRYYSIINKSDISIEYYKLAICMYDKLNDMLSKTKAKIDLGFIYLYIGEYSNLIDIYEGILADEYSCSLLDQNRLFLIYYRLGLALSENDDSSKARKLFKKALTYANDNVLKGHVLKNIGISYKKNIIKRLWSTIIRHWNAMPYQIARA